MAPKAVLPARIFRQVAGWWRGDLRADLRIPRQANSRAYWCEAGARRCRKAAADAREGQRHKLDFDLIAPNVRIRAPLRQMNGRAGEISGLAKRRLQQHHHRATSAIHGTGLHVGEHLVTLCQPVPDVLLEDGFAVP